MFDLATAKTRLNITDATQDVQLQVALDTATALAENYCNRKFNWKREAESYYYTSAFALSVERYPITTVNSVTRTKTGQAVAQYKVDKRSGLIDFPGMMSSEEFLVDYDGGYQVLPPDLEFAFWSIFDTAWASIGTTGPTAPVAGGTVKSISSDGARIEFDVSGGAVAGVDPSTGLPSMSISILENYRRELA